MKPTSFPTPQIEEELSISKLMGKIVYLSQKRFNEQFGMSVTAFRMLGVVRTHGGISQSAIERYIETDGATITRIAKQLEKDGYIRRIPNPADNRFTDVYLTSAGESFVNDIVSRMGEMQKQLYAGISDADLEIVRVALKTMRHNLCNQFDEPEIPTPARTHVQGDHS